jgi:hypothetical protein
MGELSHDSLEEQPNQKLSEPEPTAEEIAAAERRNLEYAIGSLFYKGRRGANWFFWVAALSLVNSAIIHFGGQTFFPVGLGATLIVDGVATAIANQAPNAEVVVRAIAIALDICAAMVMVGFGAFARKRYTVIFLVGMIVYLLDGLIFLLAMDPVGIIVHLIGLAGMWQGFRAFRELNALQVSLAALSGRNTIEEYPAADEY